MEEYQLVVAEKEKKIHMTYSSEGLNLQSVINACCVTHCQVASMCKFIQQVMRMRNGGVSSINDIFTKKLLRNMYKTSRKNLMST